MGGDLEILIRKMPGDPNGLDWSELRNVVAGLWGYIVAGGRYRTVTFDVLDIVNNVQLGSGHIEEWIGGSLPNRTAKRGLQSSKLTLLSSADLIPGASNSSLANVLGGSVDWPVEDSDMTLRFNSGSGHSPQSRVLDLEVVRNLFRTTIELIQNAISALGQKAILGGPIFRYGDTVVLEVINSPHMLTWGQLATVVVGLVEYMIDHDHCLSYYFTIYVGDPKVEIAIGTISRGFIQDENVTTAKKML